MKILVQSTGLDVVPGIIAELKTHQPTWQYFAWPTDEPCDYVVGWKPPAELFARQPTLKAVINYGAGVDAILAMHAVPAHMPIVRLEDAGMAQQMAEYAIYGVIHHHRHMQIYHAQQRTVHWEQHEDRGNLKRPTVGVMGLGEMGGTVAAKLSAFGYSVRGWSRSQHEIENVLCFAGHDTLPSFLSGCDVLGVDASAHRINARHLERGNAGASSARGVFDQCWARWSSGRRGCSCGADERSTRWRDA
jgi:glyoxylate/hydroxypyruvate reductase A